MPEFPRNHLTQAPALACLLLLATGCGRAPSEKDYLPAEQKARAALDSALAAWQNGQPAGKMAAASGTVEVADPEWKAGQKLLGYEILNAETGNGPPRFAVKLRMAGPRGEREVRYVVVGNDPLWVYREDDYQHAMGMN